MGWWKWMHRRVAELQAALNQGLNPEERPGEVGGRSLEQWEQGWRRIGLLSSAHVTAPKHSVGLYRLRRGTTVVHLASTQSGLRKALRSLQQDSGPGTHVLPEPLRERAHELAVDVLITETGDLARELERYWQPQVQPPPPARAVQGPAGSSQPNSSTTGPLP